MTDPHRCLRGQRNFHAGRAAEDIVARRYEAQGHRVIARRWRGEGGEIDLVTIRDGEVSFIEVKASRDLARAAWSLGQRQMRRILAAGEEFLGSQPRGSLTPCRFDLALVDGRGACEIVENAFLDA